MSEKHLLDKNGFLKGLSPRKNPMNLFILLVSISAVIYTLIYLKIGNASFADVFFIKCGDFYMDFFNSIRDAAQGAAVYTKRRVIYPPMANLIYLLFARFTPDVYNNSSFLSRYSWTEHLSCMMLVVMISVACALVYFFIVYSNTKHGSSLKRFAFAFLAVFSVPMLFLIERGNILIFTLIALMIYAFTYNSESKYKREIGLICLAFAFSIKLYPVVFGWFLIADKRFKDALRCALYGVLMLLIPSFFFGGPICFYHIFQNIVNFSSGSGSTLSVIMKYIGATGAVKTLIEFAAYAWVFVCGVCFAISPFIRTSKPWKTWILGFVTILCIPSLTAVYNWAFLIIPLIMLCNLGEKCKGADMTSFVMLCIPFVFLPFRVSFHVTPNAVLIYIVTAALSVFCVIDLVRDLCAFINERKGHKNII